jgi:hypothetical protein
MSEGQRLDGKMGSDDGLVTLPTKSLAGLSVNCRGKSPYNVKYCHFTSCIIRALLFLIWVIYFGDLKIWGMERRWRLFSGRRMTMFRAGGKHRMLPKKNLSVKDEN